MEQSRSVLSHGRHLQSPDPQQPVSENEDCGEGSDANTVIKEFTDLGYTSKSYIVRAEEYGSFTIKNRLFFVSFLGTSPLQSRAFVETGYGGPFAGWLFPRARGGARDLRGQDLHPDR